MYLFFWLFSLRQDIFCFLCQKTLKILPAFCPEDRVKQFRITELHFHIRNIFDDKLRSLNGYSIANLIIRLCF